MAGLKIFPMLQKARAVATVIGVVLVSMPLLAQDTDAPRNEAQKTQQAADTATPPASPDAVPAERPAAKPGAHQPPDESLHAPVAAIADALGISTLLSAMGLRGRVASAVGGIVIIGIMIALIFLVWWKLMGHYRIAGRRKNEVRKR